MIKYDVLKRPIIFDGKNAAEIDQGAYPRLYIYRGWQSQYNHQVPWSHSIPQVFLCVEFTNLEGASIHYFGIISLVHKYLRSPILPEFE